MLCCVLAWMNEYIVQIISATWLWLISRYSHHTLKKRWKMAAKNRHPCTEWFSSLCLQTNRKHMEKQSLICTRKTSFYTDNINTHDICIFDQLIANVCAVCTSDVLQTQTENFEQPKNDSIASESPEMLHVFRSMHLHYTAILVFFQRSFARNLKNISPIVWYCCNIQCPYKISNILYKTNEKAVSFLLTTSGTERDLSRVPSFSRPHGMSLFGNIKKMCCSRLQWCDIGTVVWCRTCTVRFFRSLLRLFSSFPPIWVCEMKVLWKAASSHAEDLKLVFFILSRVQREGFHYDKAISCNCYVQLLIQDVNSILSKTCQL